jgi:hypothetical protein
LKNPETQSWGFDSGQAVDGPVIEAEGAECIVTACESEAVQPSSSVTVTVYVKVPGVLTFMQEEVLPPVHW